jgi:hypothetical protein
MTFLLASTFTDSLARLTADEQKSVKTTAFDLQVNPANPGHQFHKLDKAKDKNFWSVRAGLDLRIIVHKTADSLLLCYVDHHDPAYAWAERRKLETHPRTGAAQIVEVRETVQQVFRPVYVDAAKPVKKQLPLFARVSDDDLLGYGVPTDWLDDVRRATEETLLTLTDSLPSEAAEALLELATGGKPKVRPVEVVADPFAHPDAQRRFRVMTNVDELQRALDAPWDKWTVFLHPEQRQFVERAYNGPARVSGSAGTGKTIVALHRAVFLAEQHPEARVLLTTFSDTLANALKVKLRRLVGGRPKLAERIDVLALDAVGLRLHPALGLGGEVKLAGRDDVMTVLAQLAGAAGSKFGPAFLLSEWTDVVDACQVATWDAYRDAKRLGRKRRLPEVQRQALWQVFAAARSALHAAGRQTMAQVFDAVTRALPGRKQLPYDFAVVDEAQDTNVPQLRFLAALGARNPQALFFAGDLGQRIFQQPFSWLSLGVDVRGRSRTLHVNYRTSHQIRGTADRLLGPSVSDVDGNAEVRAGTISVFNGVAPVVKVLHNEPAETQAVGQWLADLAAKGVRPQEMGVFVRSDAELERAAAAVRQAGLPQKRLTERLDAAGHFVSVGTMHLAKGLEFRAVAVMACDDEIIPSATRIASVGEDSDLEEVYNTERHLLYVACTRARDFLLVTAAGNGSEFLGDLE